MRLIFRISISVIVAPLPAILSLACKTSIFGCVLTVECGLTGQNGAGCHLARVNFLSIELHTGAFAAPVCRGSTSATDIEGHVDFPLPFIGDSQKYPLKSANS